MPIYYYYLILLLLVSASIFIDLYIMKGEMSVKKSIQQLLLWVGFSAVFLLVLFIYEDKDIALKYASGYLVEMSLSMDNVFVFILIFNQYKIKEKETKKLLLIGVMLAIILRILVVTFGVHAINSFSWMISVFGPILLYTGIKIMIEKKEAKEFQESRFIQWIKRKYRFTNKEHNGKYFLIENNKIYLTTLTLVVILLATTDLIFALDSIPTIISLVKTKTNSPFTDNQKLVIYAANIFALLGLRALFIILQNVANKFQYLQKAIGLVLVFIGLKMLLEFIPIHISVAISLIVIITILILGILISKIKKSDNLKGT